MGDVLVRPMVQFPENILDEDTYECWLGKLPVIMHTFRISKCFGISVPAEREQEKFQKRRSNKLQFLDMECMEASFALKSLQQKNEAVQLI